MSTENVGVPPLDCLSICTGGGGLDLAVELAIPSARVRCMVEREAFAVATLVQAMQQGLLAPAPVWTDARTFNGRRWRGCLDGVFGGIPCQPHSLAGLRLGEEDERDLWGTARRILIQSGAWFLLLENVGGMLSSGGAERVWRDLHRLGFQIEGGLFRASEVSAPHERERLFVLAVHDGRFHQMAHADDAGLQGRQRCGPPRPRDRAPAPGPAAQLRSAPVGDPQGVGSGRGLREAGEVQHGVDAASSGRPVVDSIGGGRDGRPDLEERGPEGRAAAQQSGQGGELGDAQRGGFAGNDGRRAGQESADGRGPVGHAPGGNGPEPWGPEAHNSAARGRELGRPDGRLFPPRPRDLDGWADTIREAPHLEPAVCGMADGLAPRVDQLRLLGNGVVPLEGGHALRTLATRLSASSPGAAFLVSLMDHDAV